MTTSISAIRPRATVKATTASGLPCDTTTTPAAPLTIAGRASPAKGRPDFSTRRATASAPTSGGRARGLAPPRSMRKTTSGSSTSRSRPSGRSPRRGRRTCRAGRTRAAPAASGSRGRRGARRRPSRRGRLRPPALPLDRRGLPARVAKTPHSPRAGLDERGACRGRRARPRSSASRPCSRRRPCRRGSAAATTPAPRPPPRSPSRASGTRPRADARGAARTRLSAGHARPPSQPPVRIRHSTDEHDYDDVTWGTACGAAIRTQELRSCVRLRCAARADRAHGDTKEDELRRGARAPVGTPRQQRRLPGGRRRPFADRPPEPRAARAPLGRRAREAAGRIGEIVETLHLSELVDRAVAGYSGGERRQLEIGRALVSRPRVVLLDEPTVGLDPRIRAELLDLIAGLRDRTETTILLTTHYLDEAERLCDRLAIIHSGRIVGLDAPGRLLAQVGAEILELRVRGSAAEALAALRGRGVAGEDAFAVGATVTVPLHGLTASAAIAVVDELGLATAIGTRG